MPRLHANERKTLEPRLNLPAPPLPPPPPREARRPRPRTFEELRDTVPICALFNCYNSLFEGYADLFTRNGARLAKEGCGNAARNELGGR